MTSAQVLVHSGDDTLASLSNGAATFLFFDDFEDGVFSEQWGLLGTPATAVEADGKLEFQGDGNWESLVTKAAFTSPVTVHQELLLEGTGPGPVIARSDEVARYTFRQGQKGLWGTTIDEDVDSTNGYVDQNYPGTERVTDEVTKVVFSVGLKESELKVLEFCQEQECTSSARTFGGIVFPGDTGMRFGVSTYNDTQRLEMYTMFITQYAPDVTAAID